MSHCTFKPLVNPKSARIVEDLEVKMRESQSERWDDSHMQVIRTIPVEMESERSMHGPVGGSRNNHIG